MKKKCELLIINMSNEFDKIENNIKTTTGISFYNFFCEQKKYITRLVDLAVLYANTKKNGFFALTPVFLKKLVQLNKRKYEIYDILYDNNIDVLNFDEPDKWLNKILKTLFDDNTNEYISVFLHEWEYCEKIPQEITWIENNQQQNYLIKDIKSLCEFLSTTKNIKDLYINRYWEDIAALEEQINRASNLLSTPLEKTSSFAENLAYNSLLLNIENLKEQLEELK